MDFKYAIFDMDGTLLDSMLVWNEAMDDYLKRYGYRFTDELFHEVRRMSNEQLATCFKEKFSLLDTPDKIFQDINDIVEIYYRDQVEVKCDAVQYVKHLYESGVKMCIATSTLTYLARPALERTQLLQYFSNIYCDDDFNCLKSNPDFYHQVARLEHYDMNETAIFEDSLYAVKSAKETGCKYVIGVYDSVADSQKDEIASIADCFIYEFKELL